MVLLEYSVLMQSRVCDWPLVHSHTGFDSTNINWVRPFHGGSLRHAPKDTSQEWGCLLVIRQWFQLECFSLAGDCMSHSVEGKFNHFKPSHHSWWSNISYGKGTLDMQSLGLSIPLTWFHRSGSVNSRVYETNKCLETSWVADKPTDDNSTVCPGVDTIEM